MWFIPVNIVIASTLGSLLGYVLALIIRPPPQFFNLTVVMVGIGNIGNVPLVLLSSICSDHSSPFGAPAKCYRDGVAYISFGQWVGAVIVYTWAYNMLAPPPGHATSSNQLPIPPNPSPPQRHLSWEDNEDYDYVPLLQPHDVSTPWSSRVRMDTPASDVSASEALLSQPGTGVRKGQVEAASEVLPEDETPPHRVARWRFVAGQDVEQLEDSYSNAWRSLGSLVDSLHLKEIMQPPVISSILALVVGCMPAVKSVLFDEDAPLLWVIDGLNIMGGAMIPCILLALGGNLVGGPGSSTLGTRTTVGITATRLLLSPLIGLSSMYVADHFGWLPPNNPMFRFILLLQHSMPSSILVGAVTTMRGFAEKEAAAILFWEHICAVITMACWLMLYLRILFPH